MLDSKKKKGADIKKKKKRWGGPHSFFSTKRQNAKHVFDYVAKCGTQHTSVILRSLMLLFSIIVPIVSYIILPSVVKALKYLKSRNLVEK